MRSIVWYFFTLGIPLLGLAICTVGGVAAYRRARQQRLRPWAAALGYLAATTLPIVLAIISIKLGSYLAHKHEIYVFFGEGTWALFTLMLCYSLLAVISNLVLWVALGVSRGRQHQARKAPTSVVLRQ